MIISTSINRIKMLINAQKIDEFALFAWGFLSLFKNLGLKCYAPKDS